MAKFEFVAGKGLGKDQQGMVDYLPTPCPVNGKGLGYTGQRRKNQWKRVNHPVHAPVRMVETVYRGLPEPIPFKGYMYPGFEIFKDVMNFNEYAGGYKEVNLLEAKPESKG